MLKFNGMRARQFGRWIWLIGLVWGVAFARAQDGLVAMLDAPVAEAYPRLTTYLDLHNADGNFVHGIQAAQVRLKEDGQELLVETFEELRPGMQLVIAINPGQTFAIRNSQGNSRYDQIAGELSNWAVSRKGSNIDDLSILITAGPEHTHFNDYQVLADLLAENRPDGRNVSPGLDILGRALEIAADPPPRDGMERVILFITAPLEGDVTFGLQTVLAQAGQQNVRFYVWYVASPQLFEAPDITRFASLASQSGGSLFAYSGDETFPQLEGYFNRFRSIYRLSYLSKIVTGGEHELSLEIDLGESIIEAPPVRFNLDLMPPSPLFLSPSAEIQRSIPVAKEKDLLEPIALDDLSPDELELKMLVEFPDGRQRPLLHSALFVNDILVDENDREPFDRFIWDMSAIVDPGQYLLRIEVTDSFGLSGASIDLPVQVSVSLPETNPWRELLLRWPVLVGLGAVMLAAFVLLALILAGRLRPNYAVLRSGRGAVLRQRVAAALRRQGSERGEQEDGGARRLPEWVNRFHWPQQRTNPKALAYLTELDIRDSTRIAPHAINVSEVTFGSDPEMATLVLDDPSVEALHARLQQQSSGLFMLYDQGSTAGTWLNYSPVSPDGIEVMHGDTIHIGRIAYRFTQRDPQMVRKPVITVQEQG